MYAMQADLGFSDARVAAADIDGALLLETVLVANLIAWPAGYFAARGYLNQFSQSIPLTPWPFVLSIAITLAIAWLAVVGQTLRAARTTPADVLRHE